MTFIIYKVKKRKNMHSIVYVRRRWIYLYIHIHIFKWKDKPKAFVKITSIGEEEVGWQNRNGDRFLWIYFALCKYDFGIFA